MLVYISSHDRRNYLTVSCRYGRSVVFFSDVALYHFFFFFFSSRRRHTRSDRDWSSDVCSSDLFTLPSAILLTLFAYATNVLHTPLVSGVLHGLMVVAVAVVAQAVWGMSRTLDRKSVV